MELKPLQDQFQKFILSGSPGIDESIVATALVAVDTRLAIYRDGYKLRLIECLATNYPGLHLYLGTEDFEKLGHAYIDAHPSNYRSIRWFGDVLADFIKTYYEQPYHYLAELAEFEWHMAFAFDAADDPVVQVEEMALVPPSAWPDLKFIPNASVQRMNYFWNVVPLWESLIKDHDLPSLERNQKTSSWVLWRSPNYIIQYYKLTEDEAWAIDAMIQGLSFGAICEGLCKWVEVEQVGMRVASFLKGWIQKGMLARLLVSD